MNECNNGREAWESLDCPKALGRSRGGAQGSGAVIGPSGRYQREDPRKDARPHPVAPLPHLAPGGVQGLIGTSQPIVWTISMSREKCQIRTACSMETLQR